MDNPVTESRRRHNLVLTFPASLILLAAALCTSLILVAMAIGFVILFTRGSFLNQWWDWAVVLLGVGGYFGGMQLIRLWGRYSKIETDAGYTTNPFGFRDADQVHWPSGVVRREATERRSTVGPRRERMARVRALTGSDSVDEVRGVSDVRKSSRRWGLLSLVGLAAVAVLAPVAAPVATDLARGLSGPGWILASGATVILLPGLVGLARFFVERRKGQELVSRLELDYPGSTFGILRSNALREQLAESYADVSGWDWMVLAAVTISGDGVTVWGGRAATPKRMLRVAWDQISAVERAGVGARARFLPGIRVTVDSPDTRSEPIEFAPVSFRDGRFKPLEDSVLRRHVEQMQAQANRPTARE